MVRQVDQPECVGGQNQRMKEYGNKFSGCFHKSSVPGSGNPNGSHS
jgi:hypothetical protein